MRKKLAITMTILLGAVLLSACSGGPVHGATWPGLVANGTTAYLSDGSVYAVNLKDGKPAWTYPGSTKLIFHAPAAITPDGLVIVGSAGTDYSLIALNPADINPETNAPIEAWKFTGAQNRWMAAPLVLGNKLFAPNSDGNLYILDLQDGRSVKEATVVPLGGRLWAQPTTDGERIYITSLDHSVTAVDANTYEILWHENLSAAVPGSAVLSEDGMLYVGSLASQLEKFDPAAGKHETVVDAENWVWSTPSLDGDTLYFSDVDGNFYSFNTSTGRLNWNPVKPDGSITASPLVLGDSILIATESGSIYQVSKDGQAVLWSQPGGKIYTTPVAAGDLVLVAALETEFYLAAYDQNGHQAWTFTPGK
jgi:outer membrane protein assembly factor BamB